MLVHWFTFTLFVCSASGGKGVGGGGDREQLQIDEESRQVMERNRWEWRDNKTDWVWGPIVMHTKMNISFWFILVSVHNSSPPFILT